MSTATFVPRISRRQLIVMLAFALASAHTVRAQLTSGGSLSGYIRDEQGGTVAGARVTATSVDVPLPRTMTTAADGLYRLTDLPPGDYVVSVDLSGFAKIIREHIDVREGRNLALDLTLIAAPISDVVTVRADTPLLETKSAVQAMNIRGDLQRALPLSSLATWSDFLLLSAGIATTQARFQTYNLLGTTHASGVFLVDGADATSVLQGSTLYSQFSGETFEDIEVKTGGVDAAMPLGLGPVVTIATRSGGDRLHGVATWAYQPKSWNGSNTPGGRDLTVDVHQADAAIGGAIVARRAWFFGSGRLARNHTGNPQSTEQRSILRTLQPDYSPSDNAWEGQFGFAKLTAQPSPRHAVTATVSHDVITLGSAQPNETGTFREVTAGGPGYFARLSSMWSASLQTRVSVNYNGKQQHTRNFHSDRPGVAVHQGTFSSAGRQVGTGVIGVLDASMFPATDFDVSMWTVAADANYYRAGKRGSHEISAGLYMQPVRHDRRTNQYNAGGFQLEEVVLRDPTDATAGWLPFHRQIFGAGRVTTTNVDSRDTAGYIQDAWRPATRLSITAGVRVDRVSRVDRLFDVVTQRSTEIGPRLGAIYRLGADDRGTIHASWGRIHENLSQNATTAGTNAIGVQDLYDTALDGTFANVFLTPGRTERSSNLVIDRDRYHQEYIDEAVLGYRRHLPAATSLDVSVTHRAYRDRPAVVETNAMYDGAAFVGYRDVSQNEIYRLTSNVWNWPVATALTVHAAKQSARLQFVGSYTRGWQHLAGTWQPNDPASFLQPDAFRNTKGIGFVQGCTSGDACADSNSLLAGFGGGLWHDQIVKAAASVQGPRGWRVATSYVMQTGPWSGPIVTRVATPDPRFGPPTVVLSNGRIVSNPLATTLRFAYPTRDVGQTRLPALHLWNVRLAHDSSWHTRQLAVALDLMNVINAGSDQAYQFGANQLFSPLFGLGNTRQFPRAAALSLRMAF